MDPAFYVIARLDRMWAVLHEGRSVASFEARSDALRFAVQNARISAQNGVPLDILAEDDAGTRHRIWRCDCDSFSIA
jgi:hypothetical protein